MNEYKKVRLGDVCEKGSSNIAQNEILENEGNYPIYGAAGFIKNVDFYKQEEPYIGIVKDGAGVGRVSVHPAKSSLIGTMQYIFPKENIEIGYLAAYLKSQNLGSLYKGAAIPHIYFKDYENFQIPLPPKETQKQIASSLDKITKIITENKTLLEKYDLLIKSRFIEMFGDNKYPIISISEMVEGKVPSAKKLFNKTDEIKYIDISSVDNKINEIVGYTEYIFEEAPSRAQQHIRKNDILISTVRPNLKNIAINRLDYKEMVASSGFCVLRPKCVPEYLFVAVLQDKFTSDMVAVTTGANYPAIKDSDVLNYEISNPPLELQQQFAAFVQQIDKSKFVVQKSLEKAETLYKSLMQEYFG